MALQEDTKPFIARLSDTPSQYKLTTTISFDCTGPGQNIIIPGFGSLSGFAYPFNGDLVQSPQKFDVIRSLTFSFGSSTAAAALSWCRLFIFAPDTLQTWQITPSSDANIAAAATAFVSGAIPIFTNGNKLQFIVAVPSANQSARVTASINNFDVDSFMYGSRL